MPLATLKAFDIQNATVSLWVFKRASFKPLKFSARWVQTSEGLDNSLKQSIVTVLGGITETHDYSLLAQNNEASALTMGSNETNVNLITEKSQDETQGKKLTRLKDLENSTFYAIKLVANDSVIYAVKKTDDSWKTKNTRSIVTAFFADEELTLDETPGFNLSRYVDFFIVEDHVVIASKSSFESILSYKEAHKEDFLALQQEEEFSTAFTDMNPLIQHIGDNKIQLRRACAIKAKGHYKDAAFMASLRNNLAEFGFAIQYDAEGRIIPTPETCHDIIRALLDHRLISHTHRLYDVENAAVVN